jgi:hypothetical protein
MSIYLQFRIILSWIIGHSEPISLDPHSGQIILVQGVPRV